MTNSEAEQLAELMLTKLLEFVSLATDKHMKVFRSFQDLLERVAANKQGAISPMDPLDHAWGLIDTSIMELVRKQWLPEVTGLPALSDDEIRLKFEEAVDAKSDTYCELQDLRVQSAVVEGESE